jgi:hypothetical protein
MNSISIKSGKDHHEYSFDDKFFYKKMNNKYSSIKQPYPLNYLLSNFGSGTHHSSKEIKTIRILGAFIVSSVVVYFSGLRDLIPLLAPAMFLIGVIPFYSVAKRCMPESFIYIYDYSGQHLYSIPIDKNQTSEERDKGKMFFEQLSKNIIAADEADDEKE